VTDITYYVEADYKHEVSRGLSATAELLVLTKSLLMGDLDTMPLWIRAISFR